MDPSILINWMSPFPILGVSGVRVHFYSSSNRNSCRQTVKTLIRRHVVRHLIWVCTVCLCPKNETLGLYRLNIQNTLKLELTKDLTMAPLSEVKDKLVPENSRNRKEKIPKDYIKTTCTSSFHSENICKVPKQLKENSKMSCVHKVPTVYTNW